MRRGVGNGPVAFAHKSRGPAQRGSECAREEGITWALLFSVKHADAGKWSGPFSYQGSLLTEPVPVQLEEGLPNQDRTPNRR